MLKAGPDVVRRTNQSFNYAYYPADRVADNAPREYELLSQRVLEPHTKGKLDQTTFIAELAERWAEINTLHAFREGNTRTQFAFFKQLCDHCGYSLHPEAFVPSADLSVAFVHARFYAQATGVADKLAEVLGAAITLADQDRDSSQIATANVLAKQASELAALRN